MKKLLYTLLVGLVIVSCDKNELNEGASASSINTIETSKEIDPLADIDISGIIERLQDAVSNKGIASSSKDEDNDGTQDVGSYILIRTVTTGENYWEFALSEDVADAYCNPSGYTFVDIYLVLQADNSTAINYEAYDGTTVATIAVNLSALYGQTYEAGYKLRFSDLDAQSVTAVDNVFTFTE